MTDPTTRPSAPPSLQADLPATQPPVSIPIDATSSENTIMAKNLILQGVGVLGAVIALSGASESSWIVHFYRFTQTTAAVPIIGFLATAGAFGYQIVHQRLKQRELQTLAALPTTPNTVAIAPETPSAAVQKAVDQAAERVDAAAPQIIEHLMGQKL